MVPSYFIYLFGRDFPILVCAFLHASGFPVFAEGTQRHVAIVSSCTALGLIYSLLPRSFAALCSLLFH